MNYLLHGDYQSQSRQFLSSLIGLAKNKGLEIKELDGQIIDINDFIQTLSNTSLFSNQSLVIIENLLCRKKSKESEQLWKYLKEYTGDTDIILWEKKSIGKILQRNLPTKTSIKEFKTPVLIFKLIEQINPNSKTVALTSLETALKTESAEFIFAMLVRQMRMLWQLKLGQTLSGAPWMLGKLKSQTSNFTLQQLEIAYQKLYQIDKQIKTGVSSMDLGWHLSLWLANL